MHVAVAYDSIKGGAPRGVSTLEDFAVRAVFSCPIAAPEPLGGPTHGQAHHAEKDHEVLDADSRAEDRPQAAPKPPTRRVRCAAVGTKNVGPPSVYPPTPKAFGDGGIYNIGVAMPNFSLWTTRSSRRAIRTPCFRTPRRLNASHRRERLSPSSSRIRIYFNRDRRLPRAR